MTTDVPFQDGDVAWQDEDVLWEGGDVAGAGILAAQAAAIVGAGRVFDTVVILSMPASPGIRRVTFSLRASTQVFAGSLSKSVMMRELAGLRWAARYELPPMTRTLAAAWCAFLARLNGRTGRFYAYPPDAKIPRGAGAGTPLVHGGGQTGDRLYTDGWTAGTIPLLVGDYVAYDLPSGWRELYKLTADTGTAGSALYGAGNYGAGYYGYQEAELIFTPPIRESPEDNAPLIILKPSCVMRLIDDEQAAWDLQTAMIYGIQFAAEEVWS